MNKKTIRDVDVKGKRCLVRVDFNVPMKDGVITDENRINGALPTIKYLMEHGARVILCSHIGKTKDKQTLLPVAKRLSELSIEHGFKYNNLRIKNVRTIWGSCSIKNNINFFFIIFSSW